MKINYQINPSNLLDNEIYNNIFDELLKRQKITSSIISYGNQFRMAAISYSAVDILETLKSTSPIMDKDLDKNIPKYLRQQALEILELLGYIESVIYPNKKGKSLKAWAKINL